MAISRRATKQQRKQVSSPTNSKDKNICFTIMPFGGWFDHCYSRIYVPAIEKAGLIARRADDLYRPSTITNDIWTYTQRAKLILADLSGKNPNVFYELGLAHALAKPAIMITESMEDIPFDLRSLRIIVYDKNEPTWGEKLSNAITSSIRETIASPVEAILPAFLSVRPSKTPTVSEEQKVVLELKREMDLLRNQVVSLSVPNRPSIPVGAGFQTADLAMGEKNLTHLRKLGQQEGYGSFYVGLALPRELEYLVNLGFIRFQGRHQGVG